MILPVTNETFSLEKTVHLIEGSLVTDREYIFVTCRHTTPEAYSSINKMLSALGNKARLYVQVKPGLGAALAEAFGEAKGTHAVMMASDLETDPSALQQLVGMSLSKPDHIIAANRWSEGGGFTGYGMLKLTFNYLFRALVRMLYRLRLSDVTYGYRIYPLKSIRHISWEQHNHSFLLESVLKPARLGVPFAEVPVAWTAREEGHSSMKFRYYYAYLKIAVKLRFWKPAKR